jgi:uncharacterized protein
MKKPKKAVAAKPRSARTTRSRAKTGAKISKAKPVKTAKKTAAKRTRKVALKAQEPVPLKQALSAKRKSGVAQRVTATSERKAKAKPPIAAKPVAETKPEPVIPKKTSATAKAAPQSPLFNVQPVRARKAAGKIVTFGHVNPPLPAKLETKPKLKASAKAESKPEPPAPEPSADEMPEMGVEILFERKKPAKPKVKVKRVAKRKAVAATPAPAESKPPVTSQPVASKPLPTKPISTAPPERKQSSRPARQAPTKIPSILLEGDKTEPAPVSGPGHRYALGPTPPVGKLQTEGELPESYGTGTILLTARDPHWLYTHWDLSGEQQRRYNGFSRDGHLMVRVYIDAARGKPVAQVRVHPESRHWFVNVDRANTRYVAELGYYSAADKWTVIATSDATLTPPDAVSTDTTAEFGTMPEVPMEKLVELVKEAVQESAPLAQAMHELRKEGHPELPRFEVPAPVREQAPAGETFEGRRRDADGPRLATIAASGKKSSPPRWKPSAWTPAQERALAEVISMDHVRRVWMGSLEITELIRRQYVNELASMAAAELVELAPGAPTSSAQAFGGISSPVAKPGAREKGFWFNVNAELIVYGATEPDATVSIGGRRIKLRTDGSFSYRFALPDGNYEMPAVAISADGTDGRSADLKFSRETEYRGDVDAHPQDPALRRMALENF